MKRNIFSQLFFQLESLKKKEFFGKALSTGKSQSDLKRRGLPCKILISSRSLRLEKIRRIASEVIIKNLSEPSTAWISKAKVLGHGQRPS